MMPKYVLDACALLAFIYKESGCDIVKSALIQADNGNSEVYMNKLNLLEVYYNIVRTDGVQQADNFYAVVLKLPIIIINGLTDEVFRKAGYIKTQYKMSLADSVALGEASILDASILTSDHHEFDTIESQETIRFLWIREKSSGAQADNNA